MTETKTKNKNKTKNKTKTKTTCPRQGPRPRSRTRSRTTQRPRPKPQDKDQDQDHKTKPTTQEGRDSKATQCKGMDRESKGATKKCLGRQTSQRHIAFLFERSAKPYYFPYCTYKSIDINTTLHTNGAFDSSIV